MKVKDTTTKIRENKYIYRQHTFITFQLLFSLVKYGIKNPVYQSEDVQLEDRKTTSVQRMEDYNEIIEPSVRYLYICHNHVNCWFQTYKALN